MRQHHEELAAIPMLAAVLAVLWGRYQASRSK